MAKASYNHSVQFELDEFADKIEPGDSMFAIEVQLFNLSNTKVDGFEIIFEYHPLIILSLDPDTGKAGDEITIEGMGFGNSAGSNSVYFGTLDTEIISWSDRQITVEVPTGVTDCDVTVEVDGAVSNKVSFKTGADYLELLHGTNFINIKINGLHTYAPSNTAIPVAISYNWDQLNWNGTSFTVDFDYYGAEYSVSGTVSSDGRTVESVEAYYNDHNTILNHIVHFILDDVYNQTGIFASGGCSV